MIDPLDLGVRRKIYDYVKANPGVHFRALARALGLGIGTLDYHLHILEQLKIIRKDKARGKLGVFLAGESDADSALLSLLRSERVRRIALVLLEEGDAVQADLVRKVGVSKGTLSFHLARMRSAGLVEERKRLGKRVIALKQPREVARLLVTYRASFVDRLVDRFVLMWKGPV